jgi:hypothetical protein
MNDTLKNLETCKTKANTRFMDWWPLLNAELKRLGWPEAGLADARECYNMGESPETAALSLIHYWN